MARLFPAMFAAPLLAVLLATPGARAQSNEAFSIMAPRSPSSCAGGGPTVSELVRSQPELSFLSKAIEVAGFDATLRGQTFLAPVDSGWTKLTALEQQQQPQHGASASAVDSVLNMDLRALLERHVIDGPFSQSDAAVVGASVIKRIDSCDGEIALIDKVLLPSNVGAGAGAISRCKPGHCCDIEPPGDYGCSAQVEWDKCDEAWMLEGGFCRASCNHCSVQSIRDATVGHHKGTAFLSEGILYQQWWYLGGSDRIESLYSNDRFMIADPNYETVMLAADGGVFEGPRRETDAPNSGARMTGFFCPPEDGEYEFRLSSDDASRLFILEPGQLNLEDTEDYRRAVATSGSVAKVNGWKRPNRWSDGGKVTMQRGHSYFFEVHHKNAGGVGHIKLGVRLPSGVWIEKIPAGMFTTQCDAEPSTAEEGGGATPAAAAKKSPVQQLFEELDLDSSGTIDFPEFEYAFQESLLP